jgi:hypothetical protein
MLTIVVLVYLQEDDDLAKWRRYWCVLKNLKLDFWSSSNDVEVTEPLVTIPVTKVTKIFYLLKNKMSEYFCHFKSKPG